MKPFHLNGRWVETSTFEPVHNPFSGEKLAEVCLAGTREIEAAVDGAHTAFARTRMEPPHIRANILEKISRLLGERRREFVDVIVAEAGKPVVLAEAEVERAQLTFRFAAACVLGDEGHGVNLEASGPGIGHFGLVKGFPLGVILGITPFNFPLNLVAHKIAPCLATGNAMVLKPALKTPLTALLLAEVLETAGVPPGQINTVPFDHAFLEPLWEDPRIRMISFTGSVEVGWNLKAKARRKKVTLELGGNAAVVVELDADWRAAVPMIAAGAYSYAGQSCISVQRILVHRDIYHEFQAALVSEIGSKIRCGDPQRRDTVVGPMINPEARQKILRWVDEAEAAGASLLLPRRVEGRSVLGPLLLANVPPGCAVNCEEAFAPVAVLQPYDSFEEALTIVNDSRFGLQAGVFTSNFEKALRAFEKLEVGAVLINQVPTFRVENLPYGGVKESGAGREGVRYAMEDMTEPRALIINRRSPFGSAAT